MYAIAGAILIHAAVTLSLAAGPVPSRLFVPLFVVGCAFILGDLINRLPGYVFFKPRAERSPASDDANVSKDRAASAGTGA